MGERTLRVTSGPASGQSIDVDQEIVVGRFGADLTIDDAEMSRRHAAVRPVEQGVEIEDLGSTNGTQVNGRRISGVERLTSSGTLRVGTSEIQVELSLALAGPEVTKERDIPVADPSQTTRARAAVPTPDVTAPRRIPTPDVTAPRQVATPDVTAPRQVATPPAQAPPIVPPSQPTRERPGPPAAAAAGAGGDGDSERDLAKAGLIAAILATAMGIPAAVLHPQPEAGDDNPRAFLDTIVPSDSWQILHLISASSYLLSLCFFLALYRSLLRGPGAYFARLGYASALISVAASAIWMMLDGFAMKEIADDWDAASGADKVAVEQAAFAIEHFILALFSLNVALWAGVTFLLFGLAIMRDGRWPAALGPIGIAAGAAAVLIGGIQLFTERTTVVTHILVPLIYVVVGVWLLVTAVLWWRRAKAS